MANEMVKFTAEVAKGISVGTKDVTIKLLIPLAAVESRLSALAKMQEKEVMVYLGDPQGAFDFDDEERDPMYDTWQGGRRVTTDASGVVTKIESSEQEEKDENQAELFDSEGKSLNQQDDAKVSAKQALEQYILEHRPVVPGLELDALSVIERRSKTGESIREIAEDMDISLGILAAQVIKYEFAVKDLMTTIDKEPEPYGEKDDNELPDWMTEGGGDSEPKEMEFSSNDLEVDPQPPADKNLPEGDTEGSDGDIDPDELERYILEKRPIIPDITLDVPAAIERKRGSDATWREIADSMGISQGKLSGAVSRYKKAVKDQMIGNGVA